MSTSRHCQSNRLQIIRQRFRRRVVNFPREKKLFRHVRPNAISSDQHISFISFLLKLLKKSRRVPYGAIAAGCLIYICWPARTIRSETASRVLRVIRNEQIHQDRRTRQQSLSERQWVGKYEAKEIRRSRKRANHLYTQPSNVSPRLYL